MTSDLRGGFFSVEELKEPILQICRDAANEILAIYRESDADIGEQQKADGSPVTQADYASNQIIVTALAKQFPNIPIISEETGIAEFSERQRWERYWLVDPLDGTKEFIARNDQFTINIALIRNGKPVFGIVYIPVSQIAYVGFNFENETKCAECIDGNGSALPITVRAIETRLSQNLPIEVVASIHHHNIETKNVIDKVEKFIGKVSTVNIGSALKFCLLAEGKADFYPRHALTSEWDTAAAQAVLEAAGGCVIDVEGSPLQYNTKDSLINPYFYAIASPSEKWHSILKKSI